MKRIALFAFVVVVIATLFGVWLSQHTKHRQIAKALLALRHDWAVNGYRPTKTPLPMILVVQGHVSASAAGIFGAYVQYDFQKGGVEWTRRYHIFRADTNTTTWVLYEFAEPKDTNLVSMAWQHKLITVTGEP